MRISWRRSRRNSSEIGQNRRVIAWHTRCPMGVQHSCEEFYEETIRQQRCSGLRSCCRDVRSVRRHRTPPLAIDSARVTISGTSNIHEYTASTKVVRVTRSQVGSAIAGAGFWTEELKPGAIEAFEVAIPAATLSSPKEGLDKNMHKA
jgi:hypothetical protein